MMHQLELRVRGGKIAVTCSCLLTRTRLPDGQAGIPYWKRDDPEPFRSVWEREIIEARYVFPAADAITAYRDWHAQAGIEVAA